LSLRKKTLYIVNHGNRVPAQYIFLFMYDVQC